MRLHRSVLATALGLVSLMAVAQSPAPTAAPEAMDPNVVRVMISPDKETTLAAPMNGRIKTLGLTLGSTFAQGRTLATFDCSENDARAKIAAAELKAARETYEAKVRLQGLQAAGDVEVNLAAAAVDRTVGQVELAQVQNAQCAVVAPFAGRVAKIFVRQYQGVNIGTPLAEIISNGPLKIRLNAPSRWLKTLKVGTPFEVAVDETGATYAAKVSALGARVDVSAQTIEIEGQFTAVHPGLLAGMSGTARFAGLK
jgi:RND family efflux transporter MFP subunit